MFHHPPVARPSCVLAGTCSETSVSHHLSPTSRCVASPVMRCEASSTRARLPLMKIDVLHESVAIAELISLLDRSRVMIHAAIDARSGFSEDDGIGMIVRLGGLGGGSDEGKEDAFKV